MFTTAVQAIRTKKEKMDEAAEEFYKTKMI